MLCSFPVFQKMTHNRPARSSAWTSRLRQSGEDYGPLEWVVPIFAFVGEPELATTAAISPAQYALPSTARDMLGFPSVDAGGGWLIFAAPPSEIACHLADSDSKHEVYLVCYDVKAEMAQLATKGIKCSSI